MADCQKREREDGKNGTTKLWVHLHGLLCVVFLALLLYDNFSAGRNDALGIDDASGGLGPYIKVLFFAILIMWFVLIHGLKFYDDRIEFIKFIFKKQPVLLSDIAMVELRLERVLLGNCMTILVTLKDGSRLERCHELINGKKVSAFMLRRFEDAFAKMARPGDASEVELHLHFDDNVDQVSIKLNSLPIHDDGTYTLKAKVGDYISFASKKSVFFFPIVDGTHTEFLIRMNNPYLSVRMTTKEGV